MGLVTFLTDTMLVERALGVGTYALLLLVVCNGISVSKRESLRKWLVFYVCVLSVLAFFYKPGATADLSSLIGYMHSWALWSPSEALERCLHSTTPLYLAYFWIIGQFGSDGLLPAITCFIYYSLVFSCFWHMSIKYETQSKSNAWGVALFMSFGVFVEVISGIRSSLAIAAVFWCCVREILLGKNPFANVLAYMAASLIHPLGLFLTLLRFFVLLIQKAQSRYQRLAYLLVSVFGVATIVLLGPEYLTAMLDKGVSYAVGVRYSSFWETIIHLILIVVSISLIKKQRGDGFKADSTIQNLVIMQIAILVVVIAGFFLDYAIYHRLSTYLGMYSALVFPLILQSEETTPGVATNYIKAVKMAIVVMLLLACARGNLSGYKFFLL